MVRVTDELALSPDNLAVYHASDPLLGHLPVVICHGPSTTANYTHNSSRVQVHIFSPAGLQTYPRLTISPNSPFYDVVNHLPREFQGDEVYRGLAFGLFKYFSELPDDVKSHLKGAYPTRSRRPGTPPTLFGHQHAADLVKSMTQSDNAAAVITSMKDALQTQHISNVDLDFILPPGAIVPLQDEDLEQVPDDEDDILDPTLRQYGGYTPLVKLLGEPVFLPTSRLRRAPSKPSSLNKSKTFTTEQKIDLRMKLAELVDTEERYVDKLNELVHTVVTQFRSGADARRGEELSASEQELEQLFPQSAEQILQVNGRFLVDLQKIMDDSEQGALQDMEATTSHFSPRQDGGARPKDPLGALDMAKLFLEWFPAFGDCYQSYIKASQHFPTTLNKFLERGEQQGPAPIGEQAIRATLIEPVQRLPRYSLLIDQIVNALPITHPALQPMLKAKDIITNICSMDESATDTPRVAHRLRNMVESWPADLEPQGRIIAAADFIELTPPFEESITQLNNSGLLVLFTDCVVVLKNNGRLTGRDLLREIEKPSATELLISMTNTAGGSPSYQFVFTGWHSLADTRFTESENGSLIWMTSTKAMKGAHAGEHRVSSSATLRCFLLQESYHGKAARWGEDVVKARIEARFSETEREDPCWTLRSVRMPDSNMGLYAAVFQEGAHQLVSGRGEPAAIRVVVDHERGTKGAPVGHYGVEIVVNVSANDLKRLSITTIGLNGKQYQDDVALEDFMAAISRRIIQLLSTQFAVRNRELTPAMVSYYSKVLRSLNFTAQVTPTPSTRAEKTRSFLGTSPVKLLSNLWGGGGANSGDADSVVSAPSVARQPSLHRSNSHHSILGSIRGERSFIEDATPDNPIARLEQTFTGYTAALQARKGNVSGRTLLNRGSVNEVLVNDVYNRLIENPYDYEVASDIGSEVIFVAFEKFLQIAWTEQMGAVMSIQSMETLQDRAARRAPGDFADFVRFLFADMAPQNRRAFTALIKLLADLLEGCRDDGDRGALTIAFAELIVTDGTASHYINLLDRLVEVSDRIFADSSPSQSFAFEPSTAGSIRSARQAEASMTGSVTSNASSLRKKFGLDMLLRPGKEEKADRERPSMWRSLSKHRNPMAGESGSVSRGGGREGVLADDNSFPRRIQRGNSARERPPVAGAFEDPQRPTSSHRLEFPLNTIGEPKSERAASATSKKKRRSSLSDLRSLMTAASLEEEPSQPLQLTKQTSEKVNAIPKTSSPSKLPVGHGNQSLQSSPLKKSSAGLQDMTAAPATEGSEKQGSPTKGVRAHNKAFSISNIPTLKPSNQRASGDQSGQPPSSPTRQQAQRLKLQSPQKLRERLQADSQAVDDADKVLRSELTKIGDGLTRITSSEPTAQATTLAELNAAMKQLEEQVTRVAKELQEKQSSLQRDMDTTVRASETKLRSIDQLHKETAAENELLYEKFNDELAKIVKAVRGKGREDKEELIAKLTEQSEETARMKKENARLKREVVSLRTALKRGE
ncbi:hypothetical protein K4F52_003171 [Lecanicillium sp. MT-2017a]|nr:hypothetical protein K4F52_003171 [Lecanicillium sp. MT-2017a]